jgi:hypothetical protein
MRNNPPAAHAMARTRFRNIVTTVLLMALSLLILRDVLARRWGSPPPAPDVTRRLP